MEGHRIKDRSTVHLRKSTRNIATGLKIAEHIVNVVKAEGVDILYYLLPILVTWTRVVTMEELRNV